MELRIEMLDSKNDLLVFTDEKFMERVVTEIRDYCCINAMFHIYDEKGKKITVGFHQRLSEILN